LTRQEQRAISGVPGVSGEARQCTIAD